jgi:hypothetical protein
MISFHKYFLALFAVLQLLTSQVFAETTSHITYSQGFKGKGLTEGINAELDRIQENAYAENKCFEFLSITLTAYISEWGVHSSHMYVLYNLSDKNGETNPFITKVAYASAWTPSGIYESLQNEINALQNSALNENKTINFLDIKITQNLGNAYIIYEISK